MALIIETGAGVTGAEAYADAAALDTWTASMFGAASSETTANKEAAIRRAVRFLEGLSWTGIKTHGRLQPLSWPRAWAVDIDGWALAADEVPAEVIEAQHILARAELATPGTLAPTVTLADRKTLTGLDSLEWTPAAAPATVSASRPVVTMAMDRLRGLVQSSVNVRMERA